MAWICAPAVIACVALGSCGDNGTQNDGGVDSGPDVTPAPFGLDSRVPNPTCVAPDRPPAPGDVVMQQVFPNLTLAAPMTMHQIPGDPSRYFVAQRSGTLVSFTKADPSNNSKTTVLTIPQPVQTAGEGGFLGFAFHPKFSQNGLIFISYTTTSGTSPVNMRSVVARMQSTDGGKTFGAYQELFSFDQPYTNHDGGDAHFGTDGYLYLSFGDGGAGGDPLSHGQNTDLFFSKILRIDVDNKQNGKEYGIPASNPFATAGGQPETYAYGFRNPFRFTIDRVTGEPWVTDVGQDVWEEIDERVKIGGNYGWNIMEATHCYNAQTCNEAGLIQPIYEYQHQNGDNCIIGGVVYRGTLLQSFTGGFLFGDNGSGHVWTMVVGSDLKPVVTEIGNGGGSLWSAFVDDEAGEAFGVSLTGKIYQLVANGTPPPSTFPDKLSKTGCFDPTDPKKPLPMLVPYGVSSPLWSDAAQKERYFAIPDGKTITVGADGDFDLPVGSMAIKTFYVNNKRAETRFMIHHSDGDWAGYTYEWNDQETEATLLLSSDTKTYGTQQWYFPSRAECMRCHTTAAGRTLGLEIGQLNEDFVYTSTSRVSNQIATLDHIGMFSASPGTPSALAHYPTPTDTAQGTLEQRARAYLHTNCSMCHRPSGGGASNMDWRYATPFGNTAACNVDPTEGDIGITGAKLLLPGNPNLSLVVQRPKRLDAYRMPPLASHAVDTTGTQVLNDWVQSVSACAAPIDAGSD